LTNSLVLEHWTRLLVNMRLRNSLIAAAASIISNIQLARASALTTAIPPNARMCFYAEIDKVGEKIGVRIHLYGYWLQA
jgi:hypothetical protein